MNREVHSDTSDPSCDLSALRGSDELLESWCTREHRRAVLLLAASTNAWLRDRAMKTPFVMRSVSRFMPGEQLEDAMAAAARLQAAGIGAILTHLGENLTSAGDAEDVTRHYLHVLDQIHAARPRRAHLGEADATGSGFRSGVLPPQSAAPDRSRRRATASSSGSTWRARLTSTRRWRCFARRGSDRRSSAWRCRRICFGPSETSTALLPLGAALRLVKGAYLESPRVAFSKKRDVDANFYRLACRILDEHERPGRCCISPPTMPR